MNKKLYRVFKFSLLSGLMIGFIGYMGFAEAKVPSQRTKQDATKETPQQNNKFENELKELVAKAEAFARNATSFTNMINGLDEGNVDKKRDNLVSIIESTLDNNGELQELVKKVAKDQPDDQKKKFYMRDILPNLHNINRQLTRIKISVDRDEINYENVKKQAERTEESIKQVVDRLEANAK